jgi:glutamate---cysteine ligase / carboxylate-amine ligase
MRAANIDLRTVTGADLAAVFDAAPPLTVGLEEEVMLLDPETLDLAPVASELLSRVVGDVEFKGELPLAQAEIVTEPAATVPGAIGALRERRRDLAAAARGLVRLGAAGVHPFAAVAGPVSSSGPHRKLAKEYGPVIRRQLVASLQVHVAVGGAERTLGVYNALRPRLPELAALAANAAFHAGADTGMASIRPKIAETLPRQGLPPPISSWDEFAAELRWGARAGATPKAQAWWWELRPHPAFGTLEVRVPDAQTAIDDAAGIAATVQALVAHLAERHDAGERTPEVPRWRIEENRWSAARHGVEGEMADLATGEPQPTRGRLGRLLDEIEPASDRLGCRELLGNARALVRRNGAIRQREVAKADGARGLAGWIADRFLD